MNSLVNQSINQIINKSISDVQDLDDESLSRIDFQNQVQTLMEELEFLRRVHDQEVKELQVDCCR